MQTYACAHPPLRAQAVHSPASPWPCALVFFARFVVFAPACSASVLVVASARTHARGRVCKPCACVRVAGQTAKGHGRPCLLFVSCVLCQLVKPLLYLCETIPVDARAQISVSRQRRAAWPVHTRAVVSDSSATAPARICQRPVCRAPIILARRARPHTRRYARERWRRRRRRPRRRRPRRRRRRSRRRRRRRAWRRRGTRRRRARRRRRIWRRRTWWHGQIETAKSFKQIARVGRKRGTVHNVMRVITQWIGLHFV